MGDDEESDDDGDDYGVQDRNGTSSDCGADGAVKDVRWWEDGCCDHLVACGDRWVVVYRRYCAGEAIGANRRTGAGSPTSPHHRLVVPKFLNTSSSSSSLASSSEWRCVHAAPLSADCGGLLSHPLLSAVMRSRGDPNNAFFEEGDLQSTQPRSGNDAGYGGIVRSISSSGSLAQLLVSG